MLWLFGADLRGKLIVVFAVWSCTVIFGLGQALAGAIMHVLTEK